MIKQKLFESIAKKHLFIETLTLRKLDRLDFHEVGVLGVQSALEAAYQAGFEAGKKAQLASQQRQLLKAYKQGLGD